VALASQDQEDPSRFAMKRLFRLSQNVTRLIREENWLEASQLLNDMEAHSIQYEHVIPPSMQEAYHHMTYRALMGRALSAYLQKQALPQLSFSSCHRIKKLYEAYYSAGGRDLDDATHQLLISVSDLLRQWPDGLWHGLKCLQTCSKQQTGNALYFYRLFQRIRPFVAYSRDYPEALKMRLAELIDNFSLTKIEAVIKGHQQDDFEAILSSLKALIPSVVLEDQDVSFKAKNKELILSVYNDWMQNGHRCLDAGAEEQAFNCYQQAALINPSNEAMDQLFILANDETRKETLLKIYAGLMKQRGLELFTQASIHHRLGEIFNQRFNQTKNVRYLMFGYLTAVLAYRLDNESLTPLIKHYRTLAQFNSIFTPQMKNLLDDVNGKVAKIRTVDPAELSLSIQNFYGHIRDHYIAPLNLELKEDEGPA
jgi:hypothetical protein